ncbi:MAG: LysR family transcriptional regulator, partial [Clostridia bacterium]|nr:LysR family transcriptional regulator [Clostridia bacterium]
MFDKKDYVYAVYKEKSFTAAAAKLYVSQPCLSAAIKKIEQQIGRPLFERRTGDLTPTRIGYEYLACAQKIMEIEDSFAQMLEDINNLKAGDIRIGGTNYGCSYVLPLIVEEFSKLYPNVDISIYEANSLELEKMLQNERIDLIIDSYDTTDDRFEYTALSEEKILLAVPAFLACNADGQELFAQTDDLYYGRIKAEQLPQIDLLRFQEEKFILLKPGNSMHQHAQNAFDACCFRPNVTFRLDQLSTSFRLTASGNGLCFVPDIMFKTHLYNEDVVFYNVKGAGSRTLYAANSRTGHTSAAIQKFKAVAWSVMQQALQK